LHAPIDFDTLMISVAKGGMLEEGEPT